MLKEIKNRQSIRKFRPDPVEPEKLESLLRAAMQGPTAANRQDWRFLVVQDRKTLDDITTLSPYTGMMKQAAAAILVSGDRDVFEQDGYLYVDCAAAIENILLEAVHLELGACWCGIAPNEERIADYRKYFSLPESYLPVGIVALGYPAEQRPFADRFDEKKITYWKGKNVE